MLNLRIPSQLQAVLFCLWNFSFEGMIFFRIVRRWVAVVLNIKICFGELQLGKGLEKNNKALKLALQHWLEAVRDFLLCS